MNQPDGRFLFSRRRASQILVLLGAGAIVAPAAKAQVSTPAVPETGTPVASPAASPAATQSPAVNELMSADIDELPEAPFTVRLLRITLQPGSITPMHTHHGPEIDMVETGEVLVRSLGNAPVTRSDGTEETSAGDDIVLAEGDMVHFPAGIGMYFENATEEPVVILSSVINPVGPDFVNERIIWVDGEPDLTGVSYQKLGDGLVQTLPLQPAVWTVDDITLPGGSELPALAGIGMYTPTEGNLSFTIDDGQVQVTRADSNMLQPNAVLGTGFSLTDGDAAFFPSGVSATARTDEANPLRVLAMDIVPANGFDTEPATLTFTAGDGTVAGGPAGIESGAIVTTTDANVNLRTEPSVEADVVEQLGQGVELEILDGPTEADDYTWFQVRVNEEGGSEGWVVQDFISGLTTPASETASDSDTEPTSDATPAVAADFAVGSTVVTNDENVRLRPEASVEGEAIDALALGTELTVTGAPVEAEEYTWLPVQTADGTEGFVVIDFVDPAE